MTARPGVLGPEPSARREGPTGPDAPRPGPRRTCIGCRRKAASEELVRVVRTAEGGLSLGRALPGRGAWICPDPACGALARRRRAWPRALRGSVSDEAVDDLVVALETGRSEESPL